MRDFLNSDWTLFAPEDTWQIWTIILVIVAVGLYLEKRFKWGKVLGAAVIGILLGILLSGFKILPTTSSIYTGLSTYCIPMAVCMMLFNANLKEIFSKSGRVIASFHIIVIGAIPAALIGMITMRMALGTETGNKCMAALASSYLGSTPNMVAVFDSIGKCDDAIYAALLIVANVLFALYMIVMMALPSNGFLRKFFPHPYEDRIALGNSSKIEKEEKKEPTSLYTIALSLATGFVIVTASTMLADLLNAWTAPGERASTIAQLPSMILGNKYVLIAFLTSGLATAFPSYFSKLHGSQDIGTYLIYAYFVTIGTGVSFFKVLFDMPKLIVAMAIPGLLVIVFSLILGKVFKQNIEDMAMCLIAAIGGPFVATGAAASKGYKEIVVPVLFMGIWGNVIGTIFGILLYGLFSMM